MRRMAGIITVIAALVLLGAPHIASSATVLNVS